MIDRTAFYARLLLCQGCDQWRGRCMQGHVLQGALGCPLKKFAGVNGVGYAALPAPPASPASPASPACCAPAADGLRPLSGLEVVQHLVQSLKAWKLAGFPLATTEVYHQRIRVCEVCPKSQYVRFQCKACQCIVYAKAKLATETCPYGLWV